MASYQELMEKLEGLRLVMCSYIRIRLSYVKADHCKRSLAELEMIMDEARRVYPRSQALFSECLHLYEELHTIPEITDNQRTEARHKFGRIQVISRSFLVASHLDNEAALTAVLRELQTAR